MNNPFDFFDKIYCINLPQSTERWEAVSKEFEKVGILNKVERIWADPPIGNFTMSNFQHPLGEFGVWLSQIKALAHSMNNQNSNFLLFEDDIKFLPNCNELLKKSIETLPCDWDIFYVGGRPKEKLEKIDENLAKTNLFFGGYAYAINAKAFINLFDAQFNNISKPFPVSTCDTTISKFGKNENGYCAIPTLCQNVPGHSVIQKNNRNYDALTKESWKLYL